MEIRDEYNFLSEHLNLHLNQNILKKKKFNSIV